MRNKIIVPLIMLLLGAALLSAISFTTAPAITPSDALRTPTTQDELACTWNPSVDTWEQNATWYNGSTLYSTVINDTDNRITLPAGTAKKNEVWSCNVTITNTTGQQAIQGTTVTIKNALPTPPNASDETLYEDRTKVIPLQSTDPDGDPITYHMEDGIPAYCALAQNTGIVTCSPNKDDIGVQNVSFYVKDGGIDWPNTNVTYTVLAVNDPPQITLTDQDAVEGTPFTYDITVTDEEQDWPINFTIESGLGDLNITATGNNTARITFTTPDNAPSTVDAGYWLIRVNATDNGSATSTPYDDPHASATFYLNITTTNKAPNITTNFTGYPPSGTQGEQYTFRVNATDNDTGDTVAFGISTNCSLPNPWSITTLDATYENATGEVNLTLNNSHVACPWINITVTDGAASSSRTIKLNLTNTNDPPTLQEMSHYPSNTPIPGISTNENMSALVAVKGSPFTYKANATDPDQLTYAGDVLTFTDNLSAGTIRIDAEGIINFTPTEAEIGNHTINITVNDSNGSTSSRTLHLEVRNNTAPVLVPIGNLTCAEDITCVYSIDAIDPDPAENLTFRSNNTNLFPLSQGNETSATLNITPTNEQVGNYLITVNVTDRYGFSDSATINFTINNTNDAPIIDQNGDGIRDTVSFPIIVEGKPFLKRINITDVDLDIGMDNLTYAFTYLSDTGNLSGATSIINQGTDYFVISFTPGIAHIGDHLINLSVKDSHNATDWQAINFTVYAKTTPPVIEQIRPYWNATISDTILSFGDTSLYATPEVNVNASENTTLTIDAIATNQSVSTNGTPNSLTYRWYIDGALNKTITNARPSVNSSLELSLGFFSAGTKNITLSAQDIRYAQANWTWNLEVADINRPPVFYHEMPNITVNSTSTYTDFMSHFTNSSGWQQLFYDPDDDLDSDGKRGMGTGEATNLTYGLSPNYGCSLATFSFSQDSLIIKPGTEGTCMVQFRATDPQGAYVDSNIVRITITAIEIQEVQTPVSSGGGASRPRTVPYPFEIPVESPHPIELITPGEVLTYVGGSVEVPLTIRNTWDKTITGVSMSANVSNQTTQPNMSFSTDYFPTLAPGEEQDITLTIEGYRQDEPFNVVVQADVADPEYVDSATIMINAMERRDNGDDVESKITFARDLLNDNPECQELTELLNKASDEQARGNAAGALKLINSAMEGCKYLINKEKAPTDEKPKSFFATMTLTPRQLPAIIAGGLIVLILLVFGIMMLFSGRKKLDI